MSNVKSKRIEDALRLRALWMESMKLSPELSEERRFSVVKREFTKRGPAGNFFYLGSFKTSTPSSTWIKMALAGRLGYGLDDPTIGERLLSPAHTGRGTGAPFSRRIELLEGRVKVIEVELDTALQLLGYTKQDADLALGETLKLSPS